MSHLFLLIAAAATTAKQDTSKAQITRAAPEVVSSVPREQQEGSVCTGVTQRDKMAGHFCSHFPWPEGIHLRLIYCTVETEWNPKRWKWNHENWSVTSQLTHSDSTLQWGSFWATHQADSQPSGSPVDRSFLVWPTCRCGLFRWKTPWYFRYSHTSL